MKERFEIVFKDRAFHIAAESTDQAVAYFTAREAAAREANWHSNKILLTKIRREFEEDPHFSCRAERYDELKESRKTTYLDLKVTDKALEPVRYKALEESLERLLKFKPIYDNHNQETHFRADASSRNNSPGNNQRQLPASL